MKRFTKKLLILFIAAFCMSIVVQASFAVSQDEAEKLNQQHKAAQAKLHSIKLKERKEVNKLNRNQIKLEKTSESLNITKIQHQKAQDELDRLRSELDDQIRAYNDHQRNTSKRIVQIYKKKRSGYVEFLFSSGDVNDFLDRIYYENIVMGIDKKNMEISKKKAATIRSLKQQMEQKKAYLEASQKTMERQQKNIQYEIAQNEKMIDKLKNDRRYWEKTERELAEQSKKLTSLIADTTKNTKVTGVSGGFIRPVSGPVTSPYGTRLHPIFKRYITHTGVDIGMPMGSPVKAANSGRVIFVGWYGGYGKVVIIDHGKVNGIPVTTLYAHLSSYRVSNGASVSKGQIIGNVGSTGYSTGPHLHFEVRENGKHVNPAKYAPI